jgi:uncharacterized membrane protein YbhN (UPF0104 family)
VCRPGPFGSQRLSRRPKGQADDLAQAVLTSGQRMRLGWTGLARALLRGLLNWGADVACLTFAIWAAGIGGLPAGNIMLVWTAGAGAATLSPTPAGIGAVGVAIVAAIAAVGDQRCPRYHRRPSLPHHHPEERGQPVGCWP